MTDLQMAVFVDKLCMAIATLAPIWLVIRLRVHGIWLGAGIQWFALIVCGAVLAKLDPERGNSILDGVWIMFGWIFALFYTLLIYLLKLGIEHAQRRGGMNGRARALRP